MSRRCVGKICARRSARWRCQSLFDFDDFFAESLLDDFFAESLLDDFFGESLLDDDDVEDSAVDDELVDESEDDESEDDESEDDEVVALDFDEPLRLSFL